jgi:hypothetical protein
MTLQFSHEERDYIVDNSETNLVLTELGLRLVDRYSESQGLVVIDVPQSEYQEFLAVLRDEFLWKIRRLSDPRMLTNLTRRFLKDFESLEPKNFY